MKWWRRGAWKDRLSALDTARAQSPGLCRGRGLQRAQYRRRRSPAAAEIRLTIAQLAIAGGPPAVGHVGFCSGAGEVPAHLHLGEGAATYDGHRHGTTRYRADPAILVAGLQPGRRPVAQLARRADSPTRHTASHVCRAFADPNSQAGTRIAPPDPGPAVRLCTAPPEVLTCHTGPSRRRAFCALAFLADRRKSNDQAVGGWGGEERGPSAVPGRAFPGCLCRGMTEMS